MRSRLEVEEIALLRAESDDRTATGSREIDLAQDEEPTTVE